MRRALLILLASLLALGTFYGCSRAAGRSGDTGLLGGLRSVFRAGPQIPDRASPKNRALAEAAMAQVGKTVTYDPGYSEIEYPGGDVPLFKGVCTDVVIRALRARGVDLQVEVHEDMAERFRAYPDRWGLAKPDPNIDHRRVPNLRVYFKHAHRSVPVTTEPLDYRPGDIVTWNVNGRPHIGVVSTLRSGDGERFLITHNFGRGARNEDFLFRFPITGHYRWFR